MTTAAIILALVTAQRGAELILSRHNTRKLMAQGAIEVAPQHYPLMVARGPYRYLRHPNYAVVAGEIAVLPLMLHLPELAMLFTTLNAIVLFIRIRAEDRALDLSRRHALQETP